MRRRHRRLICSSMRAAHVSGGAPMSGKGTCWSPAARASSAAGASSSCCGRAMPCARPCEVSVARAQLALPSASRWMYRIACVSIPRNSRQMLVGTRPPAAATTSSMSRHRLLWPNRGTPTSSSFLPATALDALWRWAQGRCEAGGPDLIRGGGQPACQRTRERFSDETVWTDLDDPKVSAYARSKTLAERAAWDQIRASGGATTLPP